MKAERSETKDADSCTLPETPTDHLPSEENVERMDEDKKEVGSETGKSPDESPTRMEVEPADTPSKEGQSTRAAFNGTIMHQ